ncbi:MAG: hypothetical protein LIO59_01115 [Oscillospiraceae bacterium]|nr:hypothetical protein [Oscillospiraceae bacterium]
MKKKITALVTALSVTAVAFPIYHAAFADDVWMPNNIRVAEELDRGLVAMQTDDGIYLTWRLQADEDNVYGTGEANTTFDVYRDSEKIADALDSTNYIDESGTTESEYIVVPHGESTSDETAVTAFSSGSNYFDITLDKPSNLTINGTEYEYTANDASCGDLDGDGQLEIVLKWDCHGQDNSSGGDGDYTGNVYLDAYELDGTKLWRIDLGPNIRAGAHYTQFLVYDFDDDGCAEVTAKTAPGSLDGNSNYVTAASHVDAIKIISDDINETVYRDRGGMIVTGDEYFTIFNGTTGEAEDTIYYPNQRVIQDVWGDDWGNRVDRFTAAVAYLDGTTPYAVYMRGYYFGSDSFTSSYGAHERQAACAISFDGDNLDCSYSFDTYDAVSAYSTYTALQSESYSYDSDGNYKGVDGYESGNEKYVGE